MTKPQDAPAPDNELVLFGEDTGTIVHLSYAAAPRPAVRRAVVFLSTGETLCIDPTSGPAPRLHAGRTDARRWRIHLSGTATLAESPVELGNADQPTGRPVPLGLNIGIEGVDDDPWAHPDDTPDHPAAAAVRFSGSITAGSLIYADGGLGWAVSAPADRSSAGCRLFGAFQDGTGLYAAGGGGLAGEPSSAVTLAGSKSRHVPVHQLFVDRTRPGPVLACTVGGAAPADVAGEVRHIEQRVDYDSIGLPDSLNPLDSPGGARLSSSLFPFVLVRAGITGIGLVEHVAATDSLPTPAAPGDGLPDPY